MNSDSYMQRSELQVSSAKQLSELTKQYERVQTLENEQKAFHRKGVEAQIESSKILSEQREELEVMRVSINALLKHNLDQAKQQEIRSHERDKIENARFHENLRLTKIAAWTGVIGAIFGATAIALQFIL